MDNCGEIIQGIKPTSRYSSQDRSLGKGRIRIAIVLATATMAVEIIGGILSNSLALISDAGHMLTHMLALLTTFFALSLSESPPTKYRTYGLYRAEVLAAFINGIFLIIISFYIIYKASLRIIHPETIDTWQMLLIAVIGLFSNGVSVFLLHGMGRRDINIRGAFLHVMGDTFSSVVIVIGGLFVHFSRNFILDPILSIFICILIFIWAAQLLRESGSILLEATPKNIDIDELISVIKENIAEIKAVHDVHLWVITSHMYAMTAHILTEDTLLSKSKEILDKLNNLVEEKFGIGHTNIQFETPA